MGLIRKTLAVGTVGVVNGSSKKQRVAHATQVAAETSAAAGVMQAQIMAELSGSVAARRQALLLELHSLPPGHKTLGRIRQISRELDALR